MEDDVITRSVSLFYPDPEKLVFWLFLHSRDKFVFLSWFFRFFIRFSPRHRKFSVRIRIRIKKHYEIRIKKRICHVSGEITRKPVFLNPDKKVKLTSWWRHLSQAFPDKKVTLPYDHFLKVCDHWFETILSKKNNFLYKNYLRGFKYTIVRAWGILSLGRKWYDPERSRALRERSLGRKL